MIWKYSLQASADPTAYNSSLYVYRPLNNRKDACGKQMKEWTVSPLHALWTSWSHSISEGNSLNMTFQNTSELVMVLEHV